MYKVTNISSIVASVLLILVLFGACRKVTPQRPVNHEKETDSVELALMRVKLRMVEEADKDVTEWVKATGERYTLHYLGFWYLLSGQHCDDVFQDGQEVAVHIVEYTLDGKQLCDIETSLTIGKHEETRSVDEALKLMCHGSEAQLAIPWYLAYGEQGTEFVPPYSNMIIHITAY